MHFQQAAIPQRLKLNHIGCRCGTTEVMPCYKAGFSQWEKPMFFHAEK
jgi:hypothetical protein